MKDQIWKEKEGIIEDDDGDFCFMKLNKPMIICRIWDNGSL